MGSVPPLVERLARRLGAQLVETHISWVLLTPTLAYKLKKPLRLPFLDYTTPQLRLHFCEEEVRLNRRLAPSLYLGVSRVTGPADTPGMDGDGETLDHAVRMRRFPQGALFSERAEAGTLIPQVVDRLAVKIARFHADAPQRTAPGTGVGDGLTQRALAALEGCTALLVVPDRELLQSWIRREGAALAPLWTARRSAGRVRECHGDLHLANLLELEGEISAFDCIEFDEALRWIDVMEEVAFTHMDFAARGHAALGWRFLNGWLESSGDYEGVQGLRPCLVYRALVRAAVEHLRAPGCAAARSYAEAAVGWSGATRPRLYITHGLPGSGKTYVSQRVLEQEGAIRIRSDVERKRLHGLEPLADSRAAGLSIYGREATQRTYGRLLELAQLLLRAGWPVVLDAAFLRHGERAEARALARAEQVPFSILACEAPPEVLRQRLASRHGDASEAGLEVLAALQSACEPLREHERAEAWTLPDGQTPG